MDDGEARRGRWEAVGRRRGEQKDPRFVAREERMSWHGGTYELEKRIGKLLEQIVL
jgi:hypothetical protein